MSADTHSDLCDVYLCSTPIMHRDALGSGLNVLSFVASTSRSVSGASWEKHWLLVFDYGKDQVLVCDADMDHAGDLTGRRAWKKRATFEDEKVYPNKKCLGKFEIPESQIEKVMKEMCDSGCYHLTDNNCQTWVQDLLSRLGIKTPIEDPNAKKVVEEIVQPVAVGGGLLLAASALGSLIFGGGSRKKNHH